MKRFIKNDWQDILGPEFEKDYYRNLHNFLKHEYQTQTIYPDMYHIFQAFDWTPYHSTKVVILGQDRSLSWPTSSPWTEFFCFTR